MESGNRKKEPSGFYISMESLSPICAILTVPIEKRNRPGVTAIREQSEGGTDMKQREKKPPVTWEVRDPPPPAVNGTTPGSMAENRAR